MFTKHGKAPERCRHQHRSCKKKKQVPHTPWKYLMNCPLVRKCFGLQLRSIEEPAGGAGGGGMPAPTCYDAECARTEAWLDENQEFVHDYFLRKATRQVVDAWLVSHATPPSAELASPSRAGSGSGATTPVRKISAHEFERGGLLKPLVTTVDGTPTFLGDQPPHAAPSRPQRRSRHELRQLDEKELIFELVKDICNELEVRVLCHKILQNVSILLDADRGSLFLVQGQRAASPHPQNGRCLVSKLFDVCSKSTPEQMEQLEEIRIPWGSGIVGYVAESGEPVNIPDAYKDKRFNHDIDQQTGYKTRSLLCMPIKDINGEVIGVAQVINKQNDGPFTAYDEKVFSSYLQFCGIGLRNAQLYERSQLEVKRNQVLLDLARMVFEEQSTIEHMVLRILTHTQSLIRCQRVQVLLVHEASKGSFSRVFDLEAGDDADPGTPRTSPYESRFPINIGITGHVATTGETVNIADAYLDMRFDPSVDEGTGFKHNTILCMAIKNSEGRIIGVIQLVNKFDGLLFTKNDENFVEAFAIFCGMGIHNTHMYEKAITAMAKQSVTLDVLSYHASASLDDAQRLRTLRIASSAHFNLHELDFDDIEMSDDDTLTACLRMFLDLDFVERFHIDYSVLCRWLLSVKKNYRNVTYHNWRHAFNVAQMMFAILTETQWWKIFGELECLALIIGCLCHDLDHRGTNNSFQIKASSPLAQLYSTSTMEHHHFDQCLMILNSPGNQILAHLSSDDYEKVVKVLEDAILSTDLAVYFSKRKAFIDLVSEERAVTPAWGECEERRGLLRAMLMTACDLAAITKPWPVERRVAALVAGEFFRQGDLWMVGGSAGALALTGVAAASAFYLSTRPKPEKPLVTLHEQSLLELGPEMVRVSKFYKEAKNGKYLRFLHDDTRTLYETFRRGVRESNNGNCLGWREGPNKPYVWQNYNETLLRAKNFGSGLICQGLTPGQNTFVGIYSQNCPEWIMTEQAAYCYSMVIVPLYDTLGANACAFIVNQTEMTVVVCEDDKKANLLLDQSPRCLRKLITIKEVSPSTHQRARSRGVEIVKFSDVEVLGAQKDHPCVPPRPESICTICYTSGTTGMPKGVMLTHENVVASMCSVTMQLGEHRPSKHDVMISFLPLAHMLERCCENALYMVGGAVGFYNGDIRRLGEDLIALKPTMMPAVPRLLNRLYDKAQSEISSSKLKKLLFNMALSAKESELKRGIVRGDSIWDKLVFRKVREGMGGRLRIVVVGSAPLAGNVLTFARCALGCLIVEGYGQTECTAPVTLTVQGDHVPEHVGPPVACCKVKLVDVPEMEYYASQGQGEVCVQGANVFKGYFKEPEKTVEVIDQDGWHHTGDIGKWLPNGTLKIIDRRKHIFKLSQGEYIVPEKIENIYIRSQYVEQVFVHGESLKSCVVAVVVPDVDVVKCWALEHGIKGTFSALCENERVKKMIMDDMLQWGRTAGLKTFEQVKDIYLHPDPFSVQNGLLTPTMKAKRPEIRNYFKPQIEDMYKQLE